ncbi:MAG: carboxypeptidase-like regulatory domain-containing protein, partial [Bacteroidetes bacterium]|nr:carboxypeptidase-like regulatory domain-containing protein [Bacteroidota bacterium]
MEKYTLSRLWLLSLLLLCISAAQAQKVTGTVSDDKGTRLFKVSVTVKGSAQGTSTDSAGWYSISAPGSAALVFSAVGYKSKEVAVDGHKTVNVTLTAEAQDLGEVIVAA